MKVSKFVLNKSNFDNYLHCDTYTKSFLELTGLRKVNVLICAPTSIVNAIETNTTTLKTLIELCKWKKCNVWVIKEHICYPVGSHPPTHIIENNRVIPWEGQTYETHYHVTKPLYALSHYKLDELKTMAKQLHIPVSKTKKEIYSDIQTIIKID
jgi:hypothetical protein